MRAGAAHEILQLLRRQRFQFILAINPLRAFSSTSVSISLA
jgi:hypothetical protein